MTLNLKPNPMQIAIEEAKKASKQGEIPVGAVVVHNGKVIAKSGNKTEKLKDPTAHAEMVVIREACKKLGEARITECDLYVTLEPCPMCATAISFARIRRLYYGAADSKGGGAFLFNQPTCHHRPEIYNGIAETECGSLLKEFFLDKR